LQFAVVTLAAERLRAANEALMATLASGGMDPSVVAEVHEAAMELIWATGTQNLAGALAVAADPN
jgi:hypothetical protein